MNTTTLNRESIAQHNRRLADKRTTASQISPEKTNMRNHIKLFEKYLATQTKDISIKRKVLAEYRKQIKEDTINLYYQLPLYQFTQNLVNGTLKSLKGQSASCFRSIPKIA